MESGNTLTNERWQTPDRKEAVDTPQVKTNL